MQCNGRFTWEVIKANKTGRAIILTTHSMEEADLLCDKIAIMAEGDLAAVGTSMDLKQRFGVGYRLTVVKQSAEDSDSSVENRYLTIKCSPYSWAMGSLKHNTLFWHQSQVPPPERGAIGSDRRKQMKKF